MQDIMFLSLLTLQYQINKINCPLSLLKLLYYFASKQHEYTQVILVLAYEISKFK